MDKLLSELPLREFVTEGHIQTAPLTIRFLLQIMFKHFHYQHRLLPTLTTIIPNTIVHVLPDPVKGKYKDSEVRHSLHIWHGAKCLTKKYLLVMYCSFVMTYVLLFPHKYGKQGNTSLVCILTKSLLNN